MHRIAHIAEAVHLYQIAPLLVYDESPTHEITREVQAIDPKALSHQHLLGIVICPLLPLIHVVSDQCVIHVISDDLDLLHIHGAGAKDPAAGIGVGVGGLQVLRQVPRKVVEEASSRGKVRLVRQQLVGAPAPRLWFRMWPERNRGYNEHARMR